MLDSQTIMLCMAQALLLASPLLRAEHVPQKVMDVKLILSDSEVFTQDGLAYKVILTNTSRSSITISGPRFVPRFACVIEWKEAGGDWREIWNYPRGMELFTPGEIQIAAGSTWAEYGQVFLTNKDGKLPVTGTSYVFSKAGKLELRARIKSAIGSYVSDAVSLDVKARPKEEEPLDKRFQSSGHLFLDLKEIATQFHSDDLATLYKRHPSGGVARTLKMMLGVHRYLESGEVAGKAATWSEAFKALSVGLDEVRHDQLALLLAHDAAKQSQWNDLAFLVDQLNEQSNLRRNWKSELQGAIQRGEFHAP